jgi:pimeloyl-ACP methyl ester carboxylesterase
MMTAKSVVGYVATVAALLLSCGAPSVSIAAEIDTSNRPDQATWYANYYHARRIVQLADGRSLSLYCEGNGSPTVIMEAGLSETALTWWAVQPRIAKISRTCVYDRAGLGLSPPGPFPRDTNAEVADLDRMLNAAGVAGPYVLVGHSMGGYNVRLFASRRMKDVAGMVLIDPSVENQVPLFEEAVPFGVESNRQAVSRARACADPARTPETVKACTRDAPSSFPLPLAKVFAEAQGLHTSQTILSEIESFLNADSPQVIAERRSFGSMPLIILTRGELSTNMPHDQAVAEARLLRQLHQGVAKLSSAGSVRVVEGANHYIQLDKPEAVVTAVHEVVQAARNHRTK